MRGKKALFWKSNSVSKKMHAIVLYDHIIIESCRQGSRHKVASPDAVDTSWAAPSAGEPRQVLSVAFAESAPVEQEKARGQVD
jgi:hypothetical protein